jgi:hypothetical protein
MSAIDTMGLPARSTLFEVMLHMAWADRELAPEEKKATEAAAIALGLVLPADRAMTSPDRRPIPWDDLPMGELTARECAIVYVCAAWMAFADAVEEPNETALLGKLRERLGLPVDEAAHLKAHAVRLSAAVRASRESWWHGFDRLVVEAARGIEPRA